MPLESEIRRRSRDELERAIAGFVIDPFDYVLLTYVASGNGEGKVETATYKQGGSSGTTIAVLTLTYNSDNRVQTVTKTDS